jgi:hypothetical protein
MVLAAGFNLDKNEIYIVINETLGLLIQCIHQQMCDAQTITI